MRLTTAKATLYWNIMFLWALMPLCFCQAEQLIDGSRLTQLTDDGLSSALSWAWHGDWIAIRRSLPTGSQSQLVILNTANGDERIISPIGSPFFLQWSWGSDQIAFEMSNESNSESQGAVYLYSMADNRYSSISQPCLRKGLDPDDGPFWSADDNMLIYEMTPASTGKRQTWLTDVTTGKSWQLLPERGQAREQRWNYANPGRICLQVEAPGGWDVATVNPDGRNFVQLTDIGVETILTGNPRWSPIGDWIAFTYAKDMTQTERLGGARDCWIARPDGSDLRNLTNATTPVTEKRLILEKPFWSWDSRWLLFEGDRLDIQGMVIPCVYLIDPVNGGYEMLLTTYPRENSTMETIRALKWAYNSKQIAVMGNRWIVRNWGPEVQYERKKTFIAIFDLKTRQRTDLLVLDDEQDRKTIMGDDDRDVFEDIWWSPDSRSLIFTIGEIISVSDNLYRNNVYRLDLPAAFIGPETDGPVLGREDALTVINDKKDGDDGAVDDTLVPIDTKTETLPDKTSAEVTEVIQPMHMTVDEAVTSLDNKYSSYFTTNTTRNVLLFKGPRSVLAELKADLQQIDTEPPQIMVDLLAVELTDEANRSLGLDWTYSKGRIGLFQPAGNAIRDLTPYSGLNGLTTYPGVGQMFYQGVGRLPEEFFVRVNSFVQDGKGTILANPRTVSISGQESRIQIRKTLNYFFNEGYDTAGRPIVKKSDISADTEGRITPILLGDGRIHMTVDIKVGSFTFTPEAGLPEQTNRESTAVVTVSEGETLVLGGLRQQEMNKSTVKVPILGDIPLLGLLFKKEEKQVKHSVLTLFITPHILKEGEPTPDWQQLKKMNGDDDIFTESLTKWLRLAGHENLLESVEME